MLSIAAMSDKWIRFEVRQALHFRSGRVRAKGFIFFSPGRSQWHLHLEVDNGHNVARLICTAAAQFRRMLSHQGQTCTGA
jgi:hypothetical protein